MHDLLRLHLTAAVDHRIIGVTRKRTLREVPLHPCVKRIVHEQIHQHRADHSALGCAADPRQSRSVRSLKRRSQPPLDIQQEAMINLIECRLDVKLNNPVVFPAALTRCRNRLFRRPPGPVSIGIFMEYRLKYRLDHELDNRLRNSI